MITNKVASAMATQVRRVNESPERLMERLEELQAENERLRTLLHQYQPASPFVDDVPQVVEESYPGAVIYRGRPVLTVKQVAKKLGISYWKAYRIVQTGVWLYAINESGHYMIYANQPLTIPPGKHKSRRVS